jgi:hypothetical protein
MTHEQDNTKIEAAGHTPGPWHVEKRDTAFQIVAADGLRVLGTSWHSHLRNPYPLMGEASANARLAAAAPAMLEALKAAYGLIDDVVVGEDPDMAIEKMSDVIGAAIAKAEGRTS